MWSSLVDYEDDWQNYEYMQRVKSLMCKHKIFITNFCSIIYKNLDDRVNELRKIIPNYAFVFSSHYGAVESPDEVRVNVDLVADQIKLAKYASGGLNETVIIRELPSIQDLHYYIEGAHYKISSKFVAVLYAEKPYLGKSFITKPFPYKCSREEAGVIRTLPLPKEIIKFIISMFNTEDYASLVGVTEQVLLEREKELKGELFLLTNGLNVSNLMFYVLIDAVELARYTLEKEKFDRNYLLTVVPTANLCRKLLLNKIA